jgi:ABC-type sugar transport system ATPase subunit
MTSIVFDKVSFGYSDGLPIFQELTVRLVGGDSEGIGRLVAIMGPSGSGKTTFLRLVSGVERPRFGSLSISPSNASVSYLQQEPVLFEHLSRKENARYFTLVQSTKSQFDELTFQRLSVKLKLTPVLEAPGGMDEMSGGERQRLSLLRALSIRPRILLLDEPCTGLDVGVKLEFLQMLREVVDEFGLLALYVTHHAEEADLVADDLLYLSPNGRDAGASATLLPTEEAFEHPPSVEAAQASMSPAGNVITCSVEGSGIVTSSSGSVLGRIGGVGLPEGRYLLVFPPESVKWTEGGEQRVAPVGRSARYWFVKAPEDEQLIGPRTDYRPESFRLNGSVVAFLNGRGIGIRVTIAR